MRILKRDNNTLEIGHYSDWSEAKSISVEVVVDLNGFGEPVGLEILDLVQQLGDISEQLLSMRLEGHERRLFSYDKSCDASYCKLSPDRSMDQIPAKAELALDSAGNVIAISVDLG